MRTVGIGSRIRHLRKDRTLTQAQLAEQIGVQQSDLCRMETGEYRVSIDVLFRILLQFKMSVADFFQEENHPVHPELREMLNQLESLTPASRAEIREFLRFKIAQEKTK